MSHAEGENICNRVVAYDHRRNRLSVYRSRFGFAVLDLRDHILDRLRFMPDRVREMRTVKNEPFVNFALMKDIKKAVDAGVIHPNVSLDGEYEENHLSELERILKALDEVEDFITVKTLIKYHKDLFVRILDYMNKEGE